MTFLALGWALTGGSSIHSCHDQSTNESCSAIVVEMGLYQANDHEGDNAACPACTILRQLFSSSAPSGVTTSPVLSDGSLVVTPTSICRQEMDADATERGPPAI